MQFEDKAAEVDAVKKTVLDIIDSYAFRDVALDLSEHYPNLSMDYIKELDDIKADDDMTVIDLYSKVNDIITKVLDSHYNFMAPCVNSFTYFIPYNFVVDSTKLDDGTILYTTQMFHMIPIGFDYEIPDGASVISLSLGDLDQQIGEQPHVTLARWADKYQSVVRSHLGEYTLSIASRFAARSPLLKPFSPGDIQVTYMDPSTYETVTKTITWMELATKSFKGVDEVCPLQHGSRSNSPALQNMTKAEIQATIKDILSRDRNSVLDHQAQLKKIFNTLNYTEEQQAENRERIAQALYNNTEGSLRSNEFPEEPFVSFDSNSEIVGYVYPKSKIALLSVPTYAPENEDDAVRAIIDTVEYAKAQKVEKFILFQLMNGGGDANMMELVRAVFWPHLYPRSFDQRMPVSSLNSILNDVYEKDEDTQVFDTDGKESPSIYSLEPHETLTFSGKPDGEEVSREHEWSRRFRFLFNHYVTKDGMYPHSYDLDPPFTPQQFIAVTDYVCVSACSFVTKWIQENRLGKVIGIGEDFYNPDNKPSDTSNSPSGPVITVSQLGSLLNSLNNSTSDVEIPTFPRPETDMRYTLGPTYNILRDANGVITDAVNNTINEFYPIDADGTLPHFTYQGAAQSRTFLEKLAVEILPLFDTCASWEVSANSTDQCKQASEGETRKEHALYGHPCDTTTKKFDTSKCVFYRCEKGYYPNRDGNCVSIPGYVPPSPHTPTPQPTPGPGTHTESGSSGRAHTYLYYIIIPLSCAFLVLAVVLIVVVFVICSRRRPSAVEAGEMKQLLG